MQHRLTVWPGCRVIDVCSILNWWKHGATKGEGIVARGSQPPNRRRKKIRRTRDEICVARRKERHHASDVRGVAGVAQGRALGLLRMGIY